MNTLNLTRLFLLATFLFTAKAVFALTPTESLEQQAYDFLSVHYNKSKPDVRTQIKVNPISRTIKLKACTEDTHFQAPKGSGNRITFKATCPSPQWQIFITAKVNHFADVVVSNNNITKNSTLARSDLRIKEIDVTTLRSAYFTSVAELIGWSSKRNIAEGSVLTAGQLKAPLAIRKGYAVIIEANRNGVSIKASGTALEDGEIGQQIQIRNDRSGNTIKAVVIKPGLVRVP